MKLLAAVVALVIAAIGHFSNTHTVKAWQERQTAKLECALSVTASAHSSLAAWRSCHALTVCVLEKWPIAAMTSATTAARSFTGADPMEPFSGPACPIRQDL